MSGVAPRRPPALRRSWLFVAGADGPRLEAAGAIGADVLIQELEDFTPPDMRAGARGLAPAVFARWREAGALAAVRINPFETCGRDDLAGVMAGAPDIVMMSKVASADQVAALDQAIGDHERSFGLPVGSTEIVPNIETAAGLVRAGQILSASSRITAALVASEDMAADLGAERSAEGSELAAVRERFLIECVAAGAVAIDCPFTFSGLDEAETDLLWARRRGFRAKSIVAFEQVALVNRILTPGAGEVAEARRRVAAFEAARRAGIPCEIDGHLVEVPTVNAARRLIERAEAFAALDA
ncbi:HpcH/HpaI aldolase/citrate lyase family protein [Phreatobacter sp.]|uniref:HpcH/HpaI aldolase/citrate lyase family protein n=1 Tax=Phreatobacter sp. TaxID=1966341 RepID=UPI003F70BD08